LPTPPITFRRKRRDDGHAEAIEIAFPAEAVRVEGEEREEKGRDGEEQGHGPVVDGLATRFFEVSGWEGALQALLEFFLLVGEECEFRAKRGYFGVVSDGAALGFVVAVIVDLDSTSATAFRASLRRGFGPGFRGSRGPLHCCLAGIC
jgi:hypothetical protein